jgi:hypothetical protein
MRFEWQTARAAHLQPLAGFRPNRTKMTARVVVGGLTFSTRYCLIRGVFTPQVFP